MWYRHHCHKCAKVSVKSGDNSTNTTCRGGTPGNITNMLCHLAPRGHLKYHITITQIDEKLQLRPFAFFFFVSGLAQTVTTESGWPSPIQLDMCTYKSYLWLTDRGFINHSNVKQLEACHSKLMLCLVSLWLVLWLAELVLQGDSVWAGTDGWTWKGTHTHNVWITIYHGPRACVILEPIIRKWNISWIYTPFEPEIFTAGSFLKLW